MMLMVKVMKTRPEIIIMKKFRRQLLGLVIILLDKNGAIGKGFVHGLRLSTDPLFGRDANTCVKNGILPNL